MDFDKEINKFLGEDFASWVGKKLNDRRKNKTITTKPKPKQGLLAAIKKRNQMLSAATEGTPITNPKLAAIRAKLALRQKETGKGPYGTAPAGWGKQTPVARPKPIQEYTLEDWIVETYTNMLFHDALKVGFKETTIIENGVVKLVTEDIEEAKIYALLRAEEILENIQTIEESGYQEFFKAQLAKRGVKSPMELSKEDRKKFFAKLKADWSSKK